MLLNETENKRADDFAMDHYRRHKKTAKAVVTATATGLGYSVEVTCPHCGKTENITDSSSW